MLQKKKKKKFWIVADCEVICSNWMWYISLFGHFLRFFFEMMLLKYFRK